MPNHFNHDYDGGSPDIPLSVGDRFYGQDRGLDFEFLRDRIGKVVEDLLEGSAIKVSGGTVTQGAGDTISITPCVGYGKFSVDIPGDFGAANPPTVTTEDVVARVESTQQTDLAIPGATLDGVTPNYVKLQYNETAVYSRARAKKAGSYDYQVESDFTIVINTVAPGTYDILLATFTGVAAGTFTVVNEDPQNISRLTHKTVTIEEAVVVNDVVVANYDRTEYVKASTAWAALIDTVLFDSSAAGSNEFSSICRVGNTNKYLIAWMQTSVGFSVDAAIFEVDKDGTITLGATQTYYALQVSAVRAIALTDTTVVVTYLKQADQHIHGRVSTVSGTTLSAPGTELQLLEVGTTFNGQRYGLVRLSATHFVCAAIRATPNTVGVGFTFTVSGTTITQAGTGVAMGGGQFGTATRMSYAGLSTDNYFVYMYSDLTGLNDLEFEVVHVTTGGVWTKYPIGLVSSYNDSDDVLPYELLPLSEDRFIAFCKLDPSIDHVTVIVGSFDVSLLEGEFLLTEREWYNYEDVLPNNDLSSGPWVGAHTGNRTPLGSVAYFNANGRTHRADILGTSLADMGISMPGKDWGVVLNAQSGNVHTFEAVPRVIGFADQAAGASSSLRVQFRGIRGGFSGLIPEKEYYLTETGTIDVAGLVRVGKAISETELDIGIVDTIPGDAVLTV